MTHFTKDFTSIGGALWLGFWLAAAASGATSFSNSLTGFTGNSTMAGTQAALSAAGFNFFSTAGLAEDFTSDPTVVFDSGGAKFGNLFAGDGGRNYIRTNDSDYVTTDFVAEVSVAVDTLETDQVFFGMGSGDTALFGVPDWSTQFSSTFVTPEPGFMKTWSSSNDVNVWNDNDPRPELAGAGTHRLRMSFDSAARTMTYSIDVNYAGGAFTADYTAPPLSLVHINCPADCGGGTDADFFGEDGWPTEPSRIYFGGDDDAVFRDFSVMIEAPPGVPGDYNNNGTVDAADYVLWRDGGPLANEGASTGTVDPADYDFWRARFGATAGANQASAAVPEPAAIGSLLIGAVPWWIRVRRRRVD
jgi:hypothetical protein